MIKIIRVNEKLQTKKNWDSIKEAQQDTGIYNIGSQTQNGDIIYCPESDTYIMRFEDYAFLKTALVKKLTPEFAQKMKDWNLNCTKKTEKTEHEK